MVLRVLILAGMLQLTVRVGAQVTGITETGATTRVAGGTQAQRK